MASRERDEGQVILLAGVLLVLAFILFSLQLSVLVNVGAQVGRETGNPLLEDYLLIRRGLETTLKDELRDPRAASTTLCPDLLDFGFKVKTILGALSTEEANRGQAFHWERIETSAVVGGFNVRIDLRLSDGISTVGERVDFTVTCTGVPITPASCTGGTCIIK